MTKDERREQSFREMDWAERIGALLGVIILLLLLLVPGVFFDWTFHRFAGDWKGFLLGAARDGATWAVSLGFWFVAALIAGAINPSAPKDDKSEDEREDGVSEDMRDEAHQATSQEHSASDGQDSGQRRPPGSPFVDDDLASLCTDKACAEVLGLSGRCTMKDVRSAYWRKIAEYHPGKVAQLGPKLRELAEAESKRLNIAYQYFEEHHGQAVPPPEDDGLASLCTDAACAEALGIDTTYVITMGKVRRAYREQIASYHPDKVAHLGPKLRELAELESKRLNMAYQYFESRYYEDA